MTTNSPQHLPLPSYSLLRLQWDMHRLLQLSAGAEPLSPVTTAVQVRTGGQASTTADGGFTSWTVIEEADS